MLKQPLIILGMHRSGTSLITQWLYKCGLNVGDRLLNEGVGNDEGHFEDLDFVEWHEQVLQDNDLPTTGFIDKQEIKISEQHIEKFDQIFHKKLPDNWGWKDPRTCLFINFYKEKIADASYLVIVRDYQDVISSLIKRDIKLIKYFYFRRSNFIKKLKWRFYKEKKLLAQYDIKKMTSLYAGAYIRYNREILNLVSDRKLNEKTIVLEYSEILKNDQKYFDLIVEKTGLELELIPFSTIYKPNLMAKNTYFNAEYLSKRELNELKGVHSQLKSYLD
ncbi:sulfotransferase [Acinetobacter sp. MB5]|uniref:sulfotransferase n=1 Tax=Acinetobacter sp. MB5 TaxID=2069438 RepID=UPI000DD0B130|nr:sulfotransferase [Acinetobacter sp. MB5]